MYLGSLSNAYHWLSLWGSLPLVLMLVVSMRKFIFWQEVWLHKEAVMLACTLSKDKYLGNTKEHPQDLDELGAHAASRSFSCLTTTSKLQILEFLATRGIKWKIVTSLISPAYILPPILSLQTQSMQNMAVVSPRGTPLCSQPRSIQRPVRPRTMARCPHAKSSSG